MEKIKENEMGAFTGIKKALTDGTVDPVEIAQLKMVLPLWVEVMTNATEELQGLFFPCWIAAKNMHPEITRAMKTVGVRRTFELMVKAFEAVET